VGTLESWELKEYDGIFHLAWFSSAGSDFQNLQKFSLSETRHLVDMILETGKRIPLVFASTASVYGFSQDVVGDETDPTPICDYGKLKWAAEQYIARKLRPHDYTCLRKGTLMGLGSERTRMDLVVNAMTASAANESKIRVWGPNTERPLLHVTDAVNAYATLMMMLLDRMKVPTTINLCKHNYTMLDIARLVGLHTGAPAIEIMEGNDSGSARSYHMTCERATSLGLQAQLTIDYAVKELLHSRFNFNEPTSRNVPWMHEVVRMRHWIRDLYLPPGV
jgi:nucleoside-diphosphate-sugar epimerase